MVVVLVLVAGQGGERSFLSLGSVWVGVGR